MWRLALLPFETFFCYWAAFIPSIEPEELDVVRFREQLEEVETVEDMAAVGKWL